ncbi:uncharacterized protein LOC131665961 [Phymastichus coffea]|uniref:uncharacterized protein LOC131665961 n=1 Tax=Phymastichus coffea TaxID=108790 RepID=UPI00273C2950|nr:uncharacterized protein LOC131665961 [Phymastichus coffea]
MRKEKNRWLFLCWHSCNQLKSATGVDVVLLSSGQERERESPPGDTIAHGLHAVEFWRAQTYTYVNIVHCLVCVLVVIIYCTLPKAKKNLYNRAVLQHNISLLILGGILTVLGLCQLSEECPLNDLAIRLLWLSLQYFTNATVFWLHALSLGITPMISQLCWISASEKRDNEDRKLLFYVLAAYDGALLPTITAALFEFVPLIPGDHPLKANFIIEASNVLMSAPWFFGTLLVCFNRLVVLKLCRTLQPVLWLVIITSSARAVHQLTNGFSYNTRR